MAIVYNDNGGAVNGSNKIFTFTFPKLKTADVKVSCDGVDMHTGSYDVDTPDAGKIQFKASNINSTYQESTGAPKSSVTTVRVYRDTGVESVADKQVTFAAGSAIKAADLNNMYDHLLYAAQEEQSLPTPPGSITTLEIADDAITNAKLAGDAVYTNAIQANAVTQAKMASNSVGTAQIINDAINGTKIADNAIDSEHYVDGSINRVHLDNDIIDGSKLDNTCVDSEHYVAGSIDTAHIANNQITTGKIADDAVTNAKLAGDAVYTNAIQANAVTQAKMASNAVGNAQLINDSVNGSKIADNSINSEHYVDGSIDHVHLANDVIDGDNIQDDVINSEHIAAGAVDLEHMSANSVDSDQYVDGSIDRVHLSNDIIDGTKIADNAIGSEHIAANAVTTSEIADAELTTLAGMQSGTASILAGSTALTSTLSELNLLDGKSIVTTIGSNATDAQLPSAQAVNERVVELVTEVGGFVPIANETSFPTTNPDINDGAGTIVSIKALSSAIVTGSGVTSKTIANGAGSGNTVTINGLTQNTTYPAGRGMLLETTSTLHTYTYHRLTLDESGVADAQSAIDDFNGRYRVSNNPPSSSLDDGDLYFDTTANKMKVYNASASQWDDVAAPGNFFINTISSSSGAGGGSATFNGSATRFTLSNAPSQGAQQLIVSVNGVVQKPNSGSSVPSEGFAIDGNDILFSSAPASGSDYFIITFGNSVNIGTPSNNTVTTAIIQNGAVTGDKVATNLDLADNKKIRWGTGNDLEIYHDGSDNYIKSLIANGDLIIDTAQNFYLKHSGEKMIQATNDGAVELYYDNSKKFETTANGVKVSDGHLYVNRDDAKIILGASSDFEIYHTASSGTIFHDNGPGGLKLRTDDLYIYNAAGDETMIHAVQDGAVKLYHDNNKKFETTSTGVTVTGGIWSSSNNSTNIGSDGTRFSNLYMASAVNLQDGAQLQLGNDNDSYIYKETSNNNTYWRNTSGNTDIDTTSGEILLTSGNTAEAMLKAITNGTVELYYDNSKKFETTSAGVTVTGGLIKDGSGDPIVSNQPSGGNAANPGLQIKNNGTINGSWRYDGRLEIGGQDGDAEIKLDPAGHIYILNDTGKIQLGASQDLQIYHDATNSYIQNATGDLYVKTTGDDVLIQAADDIYLQPQSSEDGVSIIGDGAVKLYYDGSKKLETTSSGIRGTGYIKAFSNASDSEKDNAHTQHVMQQHEAGKSILVLESSADSQNYGLHIDFTDHHPDDNVRNFLYCEDSSAARAIIYSSGDVWTSDDAILSSDQTLKENIVDATPKLEDLKKLKVRNFNWKADYHPEKSKVKQLGFIAQEVEQVFPALVTEHDVAGDPLADDHVPNMKKSIRQAWAPILVKALQEAVAKIETLETKVAALEAK